MELSVLDKLCPAVFITYYLVYPYALKREDLLKSLRGVLQHYPVLRGTKLVKWCSTDSTGRLHDNTIEYEPTVDNVDDLLKEDTVACHVEEVKPEDGNIFLGVEAAPKPTDPLLSVKVTHLLDVRDDHHSVALVVVVSVFPSCHCNFSSSRTL